MLVPSDAVTLIHYCQNLLLPIYVVLKRMSLETKGQDRFPLEQSYTVLYSTVVDSAELDKSFADNFHGATSSENIEAINTILNQAAEEMVAWADKNEMSISAPKSSVTLFTPWTKQVNTQLDV